MTGNLQPLDQKFAIVTPDGKPTLYFIQWAQQRQIDIGAGITAEQALQIIKLYLADHQLRAGSGISISPSGNLSDAPTIAAEVQAILDQISTTHGTVLFRGAADWQALAPGTAGQFLKSNGPGADPSWASGGGGGGGALAVIEDWVATGGETFKTFSSVPATYLDLFLTVNARTAVVYADITIRLNGDTGNNYDTQRTYAAGATTTSDFMNAQNSFTPMCATGGSATTIANAVGSISAEFFDYTNISFAKSMLWSGLQPGVSGDPNFYNMRGNGRWRSTAAINSLTVLLSADAFAAGSRIVLYGRG